MSEGYHFYVDRKKNSAII